MALTIKQQNNIRTGIIRPEDLTLIDMITIFGFTDSQFFIDNLKETDPNTLGESYKNKMLNIAQKVKQKDGSTLLNLIDALVNVWKNFQDYTVMKTWIDSQWENNVGDHFRTAMEVVAGVTIAEKQAYEGL